jgi:hypothetical protein
MRTFSKTLSANDLGETGSHQAGILIPKNSELLKIFPKLDPTAPNPRAQFTVREIEGDFHWTFNFIYYNNKFWGGTRNEYRLTGMTRYFRISGARSTDELLFHTVDNGKVLIEIKRNQGCFNPATDDYVIILNGGWKILA